MFKLPVRTWILNAAAVFSRQHGAVALQAEQVGCSRQTVYEHARKLERRLVGEPAADVAAELRAENQRLHETITKLRHEFQGRVLLDKTKQHQRAATAFAMGVSLRQIEDLLGVLLPPDQVPDHSTIGRWVADEAEKAKPILKALDAACLPKVRTLAVDEIFFGGGRPWSASNRRA